MTSIGELVPSPMRTALGLGLALLAAGSPRVAGAAQTSLGNGVAGASATVCPGTSDRKLDGFSLVTDTGSDTVTGLTVTTTGFFAIQAASIWNEAGTTQYFSTITTPSSNTMVFGGGTPILVSATPSNFKVLVTYRGEAQSPPAGSTATTAFVSAITAANPVDGSDAADATVTLNNVAPAPGASWGSTPAGDGQVTLNWSLGAAGNRVLVVRYTADVDTTFPVDGTTYAVGSAFGAGGTVRYVGSGTTFTDTGLANGTTYYFRIFEHDGCNNYVASAANAPWSTPLTPRATTTLGGGLATAGGPVCPGTTGQKLDAFSLFNSQGTVPVTGLTVTTTGFTAIQAASIWNEAGTTQYFTTITAPASNTLTFSGGTPIPVSTTNANYKVLVTYRSEAQSPPAGSTATTAFVSAIATANTVAGADTVDATVTLNNVTPTPGATWGSTPAGDRQVTLNWTQGTAGNRALLVRYPANVDTAFPVDGTTYTVGSAFGAGGTVRYVGSGTTFTDTGLANGTTYYFRIFEHDGCNNYVASAANAPWSAALTPSAAPTITSGAASAVTPTTAQLNGASNPGGATTTGWFRYATANPGTCNDTFGIRAPPSGGTVLGAGLAPVSYSQGITGLTPGTTYYACAIASNVRGMALGGVVSFTTPQPPAVTTLAAAPVSAGGATLNAAVDPNGSESTGWFRYDTTPPGACDDTFGIRAPAAGGAALGAGTDPVALSQPLTGLAPATTYWFCALAQNAAGTAMGSLTSFATPSPPAVTTSAATSIASTTATLNGSATPNGAATTGWFRVSTTSPGACDDSFGTRAPATGGTSLGSGAGGVAYAQGLTGLTPGTTYHACAIASSEWGTTFGTLVSFTTAPTAPTATSGAASAVTLTTAQLNGDANPGGGATTGWFRYATANPGTCNDTFGIRAPASGGSALGAGLAPVSYSQGIAGLTPGTTYFACAIAQNSAATAFGVVVSFTTPQPPAVTTLAAAPVSASGATLNASVVPNGSAATGWFRYSTVNPGACGDTFGTRAPLSGATALGAGSDLVALSQPLTGLAPATTYWFCALASNASGTTSGAIASFTTSAIPPTVAAAAATLVTVTTARLDAAANPNGDASTGWFRYATVNPGTCDDAFGTRAPASGGAALGSGRADVAFSQPLAGLAPGTTYYACALAQNGAGIAAGPLTSFFTPLPPAVATSAATAITSTTATLNGSGTPNGAATTGWFRVSTTSPGACDDSFGTRAPAAGGTSLGSGADAVAYSQALTGLTPGTTYHACAIASSEWGATFGALISFTTAATAPVAATSAATEVGATAARLNGDATPGGAATTGWFRYSTVSPGACDEAFGTRAPASGGAALGAGLAPVAFSEPITGLTPATTYHACAIASNAAGTAFGGLVTFTTPAAPPAATTQGATLISSTGALLQGSVTPNGDATTAWFRLSSSHPGACSDAFGTRLPAAGGAPVGAGGAAVAIAQAVAGLAPGTTSFFCAIAENGAGLGLGEVQSFTTWDGPTVTTRDVTALGPDGATLQGTADPHLSATTGWFRHGPVDPVRCDDAFGTRLPEADGTALGAGAGPVDFSDPVTGLLPGRTYYACAIAASDVGTRFGEVVPFTTATAAPTVTTESPTGVEAGAAVLHGAADPNGDPATGWFRYDTVPPAACDDAFGVRVPATGGEPLGGGGGPVAWAAAIAGLSPATTYYACALAANAEGTGVGGVVTFRTGAIAPAVSTLPATDLTGDGATLEGSATPNGSDSTGWFRVGDADPGTCDDTFGARVPATGGVALGAGFTATTFSLAQAGLEPARTYFSCAAAANLGGAAFGAPVAFTTAAVAPAIRTVAGQAGEPGALVLQGAANPSGTAAQGWFRYATTAASSCTDALGVRVPASGGTDLGAGRSEVPFSQALTGLAPGTYWYCAIASGAGGTAFGALLSVEVAAPPVAPSGGCGCGPGAGGGFGALWLAAALLLRRRRARHA